jgi:hypothetical protein
MLVYAHKPMHLPRDANRPNGLDGWAKHAQHGPDAVARFTPPDFRMLLRKSLPGNIDSVRQASSCKHGSVTSHGNHLDAARS